MIVLVTYDISSNRTRGHFHKFLKEFGLNTQKSVFECELDGEGFRHLVATATALIDKSTDSVRFYRVCAGCQRKVSISGLGLKVTQLDFLIV